MKRIAALLFVPLSIFAVSCGEDDSQTEIVEEDEVSTEWIISVDPSTGRSFHCLQILMNIYDGGGAGVWCYED